MTKSCIHHHPWWGPPGKRRMVIIIVLVAVIAVLGVSFAMPAPRVAAVSGIISAIAASVGVLKARKAAP
jgi:hypothetical protein